MKEGEPCPRCGNELEGLATFCWRVGCMDYVTNLAGEAPLPTRAEDLLPDDRLEAVIQEAGRKGQESLGFTVYSFSQDRATRQTPGIADTYVAGHGSTTWGEWKRPGEKQSPDQLAFEKDVTENGDQYHVWYHESEAIAWAIAVIEAAR